MLRRGGGAAVADGQAIASWAVRLEVLLLNDTWLAFLGYRRTPRILSVLAVGEMVRDKMPKAPSCKVLPHFAVRVAVGAVTGAAITMPHGGAGRDIVAGAVGKDLPVAFLEDVPAVAVGICIVIQLL